ncbi:MAG: tetratricopeptide repeat protein [Cyanobacteria bacterium REEB67]|nr:tetratricopeptide repeat protein [Cyanobacteria bacterium REEB67]
MQIVKSPAITGLTLTLLQMCWLNAPAQAQGLMEAAGLMAMPKPIPGGDTVKNMTRGFGAIPNAMPGQGTASEGGIPAGMKMTMPDGSMAIDPKKAKEASTRAIADQTIAAKILARPTATPTELREAEKHLRNAIAIRNAIWGYSDAGIPKLLTDLGGLYERLKQVATAKACYQNALVYINKRWGPGSSERYDTFVKLAPLLVKDGSLSEALSLQQQITLMKERKSGPSDPGTIRVRINWANTAKALGKPDAADIYKQCLTDLDAAADKIPAEKVTLLKSEIVPAYVEVLKKAGREAEATEAAKLYTAPPAAAIPAAASAAIPAATAAAPTASAASAAAAAPNTSAPASAAQTSVLPAAAPAAVPPVTALPASR